MKIVTHSGHFHTDDLLAVAAFLLKFPEAEVIRSRDEKIVEAADIAVDVGQVYDPAKMRFDHHQPEGAGIRANGIPYASLGLVWKEFGESLSSGKDEAQIIEEDLVMPVDAGDNGISIYSALFEGITPYTLGDYFESFVDGAETLEELDQAFFTALKDAKGLLEREIRNARLVSAGWKTVQKIYNESENKEIIVLPVHTAWKRVLIPTEAKFAVFTRPDGQWGAVGVPKAAHGYEVKVPFPKPWSGLKLDDLVKASGVADAVFCHKALFMAVAKTREGAIRLAEIALNS